MEVIDSNERKLSPPEIIIAALSNLGLKYFTHLQELGITQYTTEYDGAIYDSAFKTWKRYGDRADTKIAVGRLSDGNSRAFVELGEIPLSKVM